MRKKGPNRGLITIAFALGLILSCFCPPKFLIAVLAVWIILLGISCCK